MVRFYDKIFVRAAGTIVTTITKAELAAWTLLPAGLKVTQDLNMKTEPDVTTALSDGTDQVGSEAGSAELQVVNFNPSQIAVIRAAFLNTAVDIVIYDSKSAGAGYALWGAQLHPAPELGSGKESVIKLSGKKRYSADSAPALIGISIT